MTNEVIDYLESKNFSIEEIRSLTFIIEQASINNDIIKRFESIYKIFNYAGLGESNINNLILGNKRILFLSDRDIIKFAYVWYQTGVLHDATLTPSTLKINKTLRTYLRNMYFNSGMYYVTTVITYHMMIKGEFSFVKEHRISYENLIEMFGNGENLEEKENDLENRLSSEAIKWQMDMIRSQGKNNGRSI